MPLGESGVSFTIDPMGMGNSKELKREFKKLENRAKDKIVDKMHKVAGDELIATMKRLQSLSRASDDIYAKVSKTVDYNLIESPYADGLPVIRFGSSSKTGAKDFRGIRGSRGENIAGILAFGKAKGKALTKSIFVKPGKAWQPMTDVFASQAATKHYPLGGDSLSYWQTKSLLKAGWSSPKKDAEPKFLIAATEGLDTRLKNEIPLAIKAAYENQTIILSGSG